MSRLLKSIFVLLLVLSVLLQSHGERAIALQLEEQPAVAPNERSNEGPHDCLTAPWSRLQVLQPAGHCWTRMTRSLSR